MTRRYSLPIANFGVAIVAFGIAACMAVMQALSRPGLALPGRTEQIYYISVTAHGVLMALVFTTFFIMGFGYFIAETALGFSFQGSKVAWLSFWIAFIGTVATLVTVFIGKASVLYTFYPPLQAHPVFYIGLVLLVAGSWGWSGLMIYACRKFKREHPQTPLPLAMHGIIATVIVWLLCTPGVAVEVLGFLLPWSLGWIKTIDPLLPRALFWYFGHPLVYFWLLPAYVIWYSILPAHLGGKLFSERLGRVVFVLFILLSTPVGFHHQFTDPGISAHWKLLHTLNTYAILLPSFITAFTVIASIEMAGRLKGGKGVFGWLAYLPWGDPFFASVALAMILFAIGGFGGAINAAYSMNAMIHNTAWVQGHFHVTVGSGVALTFMGVTYWLLPRLTGKKLRLTAFAQVQPYLWFAGMLLFSISNHITGLMGMPRRVYEAGYGGSPVAYQWAALTSISAAGGVILFVSAMSFVLVVFATFLKGRSITPPRVAYSKSLEEGSATISTWDRYGLWTAAAIALILSAYGYPLWHLITMQAPGSPGFKPF